MKKFINNDILFYLGTSAVENHQLIDEADENDWWFHLNDYPSGHCIVKVEKLDREMIIYASQIVKEYSKLKNNKKVEVIYTQIKNIRKTKTLGEVILLLEPKKVILK